MEKQAQLLPAIIIPSRGRCVLCAWCAVPAALLAPFVFWRSALGGLILCLVWAAAEFCVWARACSFAAAYDAKALTIYAGIAFPTERAVPLREAVCVRTLRTPLARLAGVSVLIIDTAAGTRLLLPTVPARQAERLAAALMRSNA